MNPDDSGMIEFFQIAILEAGYWTPRLDHAPDALGPRGVTTDYSSVLNGLMAMSGVEAVRSVAAVVAPNEGAARLPGRYDVSVDLNSLRKNFHQQVRKRHDPLFGMETRPSVGVDVGAGKVLGSLVERPESERRLSASTSPGSASISREVEDIDVALERAWFDLENRKWVERVPRDSADPFPPYKLTNLYRQMRLGLLPPEGVHPFLPWSSFRTVQCPSPVRATLDAVAPGAGATPKAAPPGVVIFVDGKSLENPGGGPRDDGEVRLIVYIGERGTAATARRTVYDRLLALKKKPVEVKKDSNADRNLSRLKTKLAELGIACFVTNMDSGCRLYRLQSGVNIQECPGPFDGYKEWKRLVRDMLRPGGYDPADTVQRQLREYKRRQQKSMEPETPVLSGSEAPTAPTD